MRRDLGSFKTIDVADTKHKELPRLRRAERRQIELRACDLESLLPEDDHALTFNLLRIPRGLLAAAL